MHRSRCRQRRGRRPTAARASRSAAVPFSPRERRLGRASDPFFLPAVLWPRCGLPTPSLPHADDPQVYIPSKPALLYCPSSLRVDPFLLPSAVPKPPRLLLLLEVKLVHTVDSKRWFKQGRKWESCSMNLGLGSKRKWGKVVDTGYPTGLLVEKAKKAWWMANGGGKWTCLLVEKGKKVRGVGGQRK